MMSCQSLTGLNLMSCQTQGHPNTKQCEIVTILSTKKLNSLVNAKELWLPLELRGAVEGNDAKETVLRLQKCLSEARSRRAKPDHV